ncbi:MAG: tetratricopeptide repeat protein [Chitinispirillaceae bacterium]|jgi:hypothetical protein|nr:tetratricopeptide repeat protein [Chitinispirillaceae bacterium]
MYSAVLFLCIASAPVSSGQSTLDSTETLFAIAALNYDVAALSEIASLVDRQPESDKQVPQALLLRGLVSWRLALVAFCSNDKPRIIKAGKRSLELLEAAEQGGADVYLAASHRALVCQLLASTGIQNGALYGPRSASEVKKAKAANPKGYFALLAEAMNVSRAPAFAGGSPAKAAALLETLSSRFPDSIDVKIHLADAWSRSGRAADARKIITPIVDSFPANLLARKVAAGVRRE